MPEYLFFWGHQPERDGGVGKGCLSQWWPAPFVVNGLSYATAEHYMMWRKAVLFDDAVTAERVLEAKHPEEAKDLGRGVADFDKAVWERERYDVVVDGNLAKFRAHEELRSFLVGTGDRWLAEASPLDAVWGIGLTADHPDAARLELWPGLNLLGKALMDVRARLRYATPTERSTVPRVP